MEITEEKNSKNGLSVIFLTVLRVDFLVIRKKEIIQERYVLRTIEDLQDKVEETTLK